LHEFSLLDILIQNPEDGGYNPTLCRECPDSHGEREIYSGEAESEFLISGTSEAQGLVTAAHPKIIAIREKLLKFLSNESGS
jgi:hypothetical protein